MAQRATAAKRSGKPARSATARVPARRRRRPPTGFVGKLADLAGAFQPMAVRRLQDEIDDRVAEIPVELNEYGYDRYGFHPETYRHVGTSVSLR